MQYIPYETFLLLMFTILVHADEYLEPNAFATLTILKVVLSNFLTTREQKQSSS